MNGEKKGVKTIRDVSYLYLSNISSSLIGIVYFLIIARLLSSYEFGIVTTLILIYTFAITVGDLGISYSIPKFITQAIAQNKKSVAYEIFIKLLNSLKCFIFFYQYTIIKNGRRFNAISFLWCSRCISYRKSPNYFF